MEKASNKKKLYMVIRYAMLLVLIAAMIIFFTRKTESKAAFEDVASAIKAVVTTEHMEENSDRFLKKYFDLNPADYESVLIYTPITNMDAEEVLLIKLKDPAQSETVLKAINKRIEDQLAVYEGYAPEEVAILENAIIDDQGNYILYVTGDNAEDVDRAFRGGL